MFLELAELIGCFVAGSGASVIGALLINKSKKPVKTECPYGSEPYLWGKGGDNGEYGFGCPKCREHGRNRTQPEICDCSEYFRHHFHYKCNICKYTNIMRTADDS